VVAAGRETFSVSVEVFTDRETMLSCRADIAAQRSLAVIGLIPGIERVQALAGISRSARIYKAISYVVIATKPVHRSQIRPNSAQLKSTPYHSPKLHSGPCSSVGMRRGTDRQTHRHTDGRGQHTYTSLRLCLMRNVMRAVGEKL